MRKVVIVQEYVPAYRVPFFARLREIAMARDIEVTVAHGDPNNAQASRSDSVDLPFGVRIRQREFRIGGRRLVFRSTKSARTGADLVVLEQARRNLDAYALLLPRRLRGATALWGHGRDYTNPSSRLESRLSLLLTRRADWFFAYTDGGKVALLAEKVDPSRITVVLNSTDTAALQADLDAVGSSVPELSIEHGLSGETAIFVGALDESKRLKFLMESADLLHERRENFRLLIVGTGPLRDEVEQWCALRSWATWLGPLEGLEKARALSASQVIMMPGRVGLIAVDSFAAGVPIVTTDWPWHAPEFEYLENDVNAIIAHDDLTSYADALESALVDSACLAKLSAGCRESSRRYSINTMAGNFLDGLENALSSLRPNK